MIQNPNRDPVTRSKRSTLTRRERDDEASGFPSFCCCGVLDDDDDDDEVSGNGGGPTVQISAHYLHSITIPDGLHRAVHGLRAHVCWPVRVSAHRTLQRRASSRETSVLQELGGRECVTRGKLLRSRRLWQELVSL